MKFQGVIGATAVIGMILASSASAQSTSGATVTPNAGVVQLNTGAGFNRITGQTSAKAGDAILVGEGGSAQVACADGSTVVVQPGSVYIVGNCSPAAGTTTGANPPAGGVSPVVLGIGAAAIGVGIAVAASSGGDSKKSSPASP